MNEEAFNRVWRESTEGAFDVPEEQADECIYARHFGAWAAALCQDELRNPTHIGINQKMLLLTKKYFEWRATVPKAHRDRIGERSHTCIFHVFERVYHELMALELSLTPPMLFLPPARSESPPRQQPEVLGITIGEILGQE